MTPISDMLAAEGEHERSIRALFSGAFAWTGAEPRFTKPLVIMAFTNRSGSNLLADYLRQTGKFRGFGESLNADEIGRSLDGHADASFPDYIARLAGPREQPGLWGVKASWSQILLLRRANILSMFPEVRIIHSIRHDLLGQAISHWIAHQTNQWTSAHEPTDVVPQFAIDAIEQILMDAVRSNAVIDMISQALGIPRQVAVYERIQADPAGEVMRLTEGLAIGLRDWTPREPRISRQRDETNERYRALCLEAWAAAVDSAAVERAPFGA